MAGCEAFNYKVSLTVVQKGFEKSLSDGVRAIGQEGRNAVSRIQEILAPKTVEFSQIYERRGKRLHWEGDKHSVEYHLRCYTVWLTGQEASRGLVLQSKLDRQVWSQVEKQAWQLDNGMAVQWLAFRGIDPEQGIALQQIENNNGVLRQTSRLLPFEKLTEIEEFLGLIGEERENISVGVDSESGLSELAGWIVTGETIDFHQDLPGLIEQAIDPVMPELVPMEPMQFQPLPEIMPVGVVPEIQFAEPDSTLIEQPIEPAKPIPITNVGSFWFEVVAAAAVPKIVEMPPPVFVANEVPTRLDLEVPRKQNQQLEAETVFQATSILSRPMPISVLSETQLEPEAPVFMVASRSDSEAPTRLDLEGISKVKVETQTVDLGVGKPVLEEKPELLETRKQQLNVTAVNDRRCFSETKTLEKPEMATVVFESAAAAAVVIPTRMFLEGANDIRATRKEEGKAEMETKVKMEEREQIRTAGNDKKFEIHDAIASKISSETSDGFKPKPKKIKVNEDKVGSEEGIPIYQHNWQPAAIKEIPEWVWQGTAAAPDEIIDWSWFLTTVFYALLNTKVLLKEKSS